MTKSQDKIDILNEVSRTPLSFSKNVAAVIFLGIILLLYIFIFKSGWFLPAFMLSLPLAILLYKKHMSLRNPVSLLGIILSVMFVIQIMVNYSLAGLGIMGLYLPSIPIIVLTIYYIYKSIDSYSAKVGSVLLFWTVSIFYHILHGPAWFLPILIISIPLTQLLIDDELSVFSKFPHTFQKLLGDRLRISGIILLIMFTLQFGFNFLNSLNGAILPLTSIAITIVTVIYLLSPKFYRH